MTSRQLASPPTRWFGAAHPDPGPGPCPDQVINNAILASLAVGRPVLVNSHTAEDFKERLPRFWAAEGRYRPTPAGLGTYGINYPPHYKLRERAISLGNVTENLVQVLRVHCVCTTCTLHLHYICTASALRLPCILHCICTASAVQAPPWLFAAESDADAPPGLLNASGHPVRSSRVTHLPSFVLLTARTTRTTRTDLTVLDTLATLATLARCTRVASLPPSGQRSHRPWPSSTSFASRGLARGGGSRR